MQHISDTFSLLKLLFFELKCFQTGSRKTSLTWEWLVIESYLTLHQCSVDWFTNILPHLNDLVLE